MIDYGIGPQTENGEYVHGGFCSGSRRHPRRPGNTCSCHSSDLWYRRLSVTRDRAAGTAKRTLHIATCSGCAMRWLYPYSEEYIPRETFCKICSLWAKVEEVWWEGTDFANLLPVFERTV